MESKESFIKDLKDGVVDKPYVKKISSKLSLKEIAEKSAINGLKFPNKIKVEKPTRYIKYVKE